MKVLKLNQDWFMWLGICPIANQTNHRKQLHDLFGWLVALILASFIVSSALGAINYGITDLNNALHAAFPGFGTIRVLVSFISLLVFHQKVTLIFQKLQTFYDQSK